MTEHIIDAKDKSLGRLASQIAGLLQGKEKADYAPNKSGSNRIVVKNIRLVKLTGKKTTQKLYYRHSGSPGNLRIQKYEDMFARYPERILINAVEGMLPQNRLKKERLKRLIIEKENG